MKEYEICRQFVYNGIEFEIGTINAFAVHQTRGNVWLRMNNMEIYCAAKRADENETIYGIPAWFILKCFREFARDKKLDRFLN